MQARSVNPDPALGGRRVIFHVAYHHLCLRQQHPNTVTGRTVASIFAPISQQKEASKRQESASTSCSRAIDVEDVASMQPTRSATSCTLTLPAHEEWLWTAPGVGGHIAPPAAPALLASRALQPRRERLSPSFSGSSSLLDPSVHSDAPRAGLIATPAPPQAEHTVTMDEAEGVDSKRPGAPLKPAAGRNEMWSDALQPQSVSQMCGNSSAVMQVVVHLPSSHKRQMLLPFRDTCLTSLALSHAQTSPSCTAQALARAMGCSEAEGTRGIGEERFEGAASATRARIRRIRRVRL